jgi:hypothetical protein
VRKEVRGAKRYVQVYTPFTVAKAMNRPRWLRDPLMRYRDNVTAAMIDMQYLPPLTRWGKILRVSL